VPVSEYTPRDPSASVVYVVVREHVESFLEEATRARDGHGLPRFVEDEFRAFLRCGFLAGGFAITNYAAPSTPDTGPGDRDPSPSPSAGTVARGLPRGKN
jgi:hypothetical protein